MFSTNYVWIMLSTNNADRNNVSTNDAFVVVQIPPPTRTKRIVLGACDDNVSRKNIGCPRRIVQIIILILLEFHHPPKPNPPQFKRKQYTSRTKYLFYEHTSYTSRGAPARGGPQSGLAEAGDSENRKFYTVELPKETPVCDVGRACLTGVWAPSSFAGIPSSFRIHHIVNLIVESPSS